MIAISTAFKTAQIAVSINGKQKFCQLDANCKHSENVLLTLDSMLDELGENIKDNDEYAVVVGPGSFTGLRIGISLVKGLCAGSKKRVVPISSLAFIAYSYVKEFKPTTDFYAVINALSGLCFACKFDKTGSAISQEKLMPIKEFDELEGVKVCLEEDNLPYAKVNLSPEDLLSMAFELAKKAKYVDFSRLEPVYLRKSQAESMLEAKKV